MSITTRIWLATILIRTAFDSQKCTITTQVCIDSKIGFSFHFVHFSDTFIYIFCESIGLNYRINRYTGNCSVYFLNMNTNNPEATR